ncbi:hypothetical protein ATE84_1017 [Aquimarina sp. MAR_2010_214]|uniref:DUF6973 domain-containing protein n=1 Tax=Aquimarina sp. MAR_2010_214 TaxID=1250026 RepID=UPI000C709791|nr:hypothetical protein [Aquimarina sp. MAR_2010_214]PKV49001.1 hypothetical protein ATE84_1017 [Aquimarina sp. MAR_2010_214]
MSIRSLLKRLSFRQILRLTGIMLQNPLLVYPTLKATRRTMIICDLHYGKTHHNHGKANAFRHALWNILICYKTFRITKNEESSIRWTKKITDLHEKLAPNKPIETAMDLQNNEMGRKYFVSLKNISEDEIVTFLKKHVQKAKKVTELNALLDHKNDLVYLSEK